jgi:hypothetical protein
MMSGVIREPFLLEKYALDIGPLFEVKTAILSFSGTVSANRNLRFNLNQEVGLHNLKRKSSPSVTAVPPHQPRLFATLAFLQLKVRYGLRTDGERFVIPRGWGWVGQNPVDLPEF